SIEELAARCTDLVREVVGTGPVALFGHSLGAVVVYESARQLAATGTELRFVGLADAVHPAQLRQRWAYRHSARYRARTIFSRRGPATGAWRVRQLLGRNPPRPTVHPPGTGAVADWPAAMARERRYEPGPAPTPFTVFASAPFERFARALDLGWAHLMPPG